MGTAETTLRKDKGGRVRTMCGFERKKWVFLKKSLIQFVWMEKNGYFCMVGRWMCKKHGQWAR